MTAHNSRIQIYKCKYKYNKFITNTILHKQLSVRIFSELSLKVSALKNVTMSIMFPYGQKQLLVIIISIM